jgi:hypothetical protein
MKFEIKAVRGKEPQTKEVRGIKALHSTLSSFRSKGLVITDINRVLQ